MESDAPTTTPPTSQDVAAGTEDRATDEASVLAHALRLLSESEGLILSGIFDKHDASTGDGGSGDATKREASTSGGSGAAAAHKAAPPPRASGADVLARARRLSALIRKAVDAYQANRNAAGALKKQAAAAEADGSERARTLVRRAEAAEAQSAAARERAGGAEYALDQAESALRDTKRLNRVLVLENAIAIDQLKKCRFSGVELATQEIAKLSDASPSGAGFAFRKKGAPGDGAGPSSAEDLRGHGAGPGESPAGALRERPTPSARTQPLDPTSRAARIAASPIKKRLSASTYGDWDGGDSDSEGENGEGGPEAMAHFPTIEEQAAILERNRRRLLHLVDQPPSSPLALANENTMEAVDAMVKDLATRVRVSDVDLAFKRLGPFQYRIGEKTFHLKNINGRLFTRKGGGYLELVELLGKMRL